MKSKRSDLEIRYILLFKLDARNLLNRIIYRKDEYIEAFSLKRNRSVFRDIFENRYSKATIKDLSYCTTEVIEALSSFYELADEIYWYLKHTQDMPNMIEDETQRRINVLSRQFDLLNLYIDAELSGTEQFDIDTFDEIEPAGEDNHSDSFELDGESWESYESESYLQAEEYPDPDADHHEDDDNAAGRE